MELNKTDVGILFSMSLAIILLSFVAPAAGLTDDSDNVTESEIPDFNISSDRFDFAGDFPDTPGTPQSGTLEYYGEFGSGIDGQSLMWIDRPKSSGATVELQNDTQGNGNFQFVFINFTSGNNVDDRYNLTTSDEGELNLHNNESYKIEFTLDDYEEFQNGSDFYAQVSWKILETPEDSGGGLAALPVVGWLFDSAEYLVAMLAYLGDIIFWFVGFIFEVTLNLVGILLDISIFFVDLVVFLNSTYFDIVSAANSAWVTTIVAIPGILLSIMFLKLGMIGISLLPTT